MIHMVDELCTGVATSPGPPLRKFTQINVGRRLTRSTTIPRLVKTVAAKGIEEERQSGPRRSSGLTPSPRIRERGTWRCRRRARNSGPMRYTRASRDFASWRMYWRALRKSHGVGEHEGLDTAMNLPCGCSVRDSIAESVKDSQDFVGDFFQLRRGVTQRIVSQFCETLLAKIPLENWESVIREHLPPHCAEGVDM